MEWKTETFTGWSPTRSAGAFVQAALGGAGYELVVEDLRDVEASELGVGLAEDGDGVLVLLGLGIGKHGDVLVDGEVVGVVQGAHVVGLEVGLHNADGVVLVGLALGR